MSRSDHGRSSSKHSRESSSRLPREKSPGRSTKSSSRHHSSHSFDQSRRVVETSSLPQASSSSTVLAGVDVEPRVSKMLKKIVANTQAEKKKKGWKNEKMELVLRKSKKKKHKKSKGEAPIIKTEPVTDSSPPTPAGDLVNIKTEPGTASPPSPLPPPTLSTSTSSVPYFKPLQEVELQPILGHSKCRICKSYYPDADDRRNQHLAQHPDRVFLVNLPVDTFYYDMEEAISHMAKFGINRTDLQQKVKDCNLIKLPTNLKGFSCDLCKMLDTNSEKEFMIHVKEECKVNNKEERAQHLVCFCRGCHGRFSNKGELVKHVMQGGCWPTMMVINRLYDMSGADVVTKQKDKVAVDREKMIRIKQEKVERAHQVQVKREMFETKEQTLTLQQSSPMLPPSPFNAYALPNSQELLPQAPCPAPSTADLQNILQSFQHNQVMQASSLMQQQVDMANLQGIQQLQQNHVYNSQTGFLSQQVNFPVPPPPLPPVVPTLPSLTTQKLSRTVKVERDKSPTLAERSRSREDPSPAFSPLRDSHRSRSRIPVENPGPDYRDLHRSRSRRPSTPTVVPPAPSTPLPTVDDLFLGGGLVNTRGGSASTRRRRSPSVDSIISCESTARSTKSVSTQNCQRSACMWTDPHAATCTKLEIMDRCARDACDWYSLHRDYPLCDKLSFYCNCKKEREGVYKYYDDMPQVKRITTEVKGERDLSVKEPKNVVMRLLYRHVSRVVGDPRLTKNSYPTRHNIPARSFRGKTGSRRGWGENNVICTWSGASMVTVRKEHNPHIVSDHDSDVEFCPDEGEVRVKKLTKRRESGSSQEREVW